MLGSSLALDGRKTDRVRIPQHLLDIESRVRTNLFPWRGQFSPGLVEVFLSTYASAGDLVFDPFAGVGTTLMEAARQKLPCFGAELNPAAVAMAQTVMFISLHKKERKEYLDRVEALLDNAFGHNLPLFGKRSRDIQAVPAYLAQMARDSKLSQYETNIVTNLLIRIADDTDCTSESVHRAFKQHAAIIENLPYSSNSYDVENTDARRLTLADETVDFVITSPPYLNVFNYHQNNRPAMELLGWDLLHVARSEFGANRKHRGNRFLTVVQYCLDMREMLIELRRVMKKSGRAVFVVGRESCIRGVAFQNGSIVAALAELSGFVITSRQERKFKNKFGVLIYEDVLSFVPNGNKHASQSRAVSLAVEQLESRLAGDLKEDVGNDLRAAIDAAQGVQPSPLYTPRL